MDAIFRRRGGSGNDTLASDMAALGMDPATLPDHLQEQSVDIDIWPEHQQVVTLFARASRQWRIAGETVLGLDYGVMPWLTSLLNIEPTLELLDDLQTMESRAVKILNEPAKKAKAKKGRRS